MLISLVQGSEKNLVTLIISKNSVVIRSLIRKELDRISLLKWNEGNFVSLNPALPSNVGARIEPGSIYFSKPMTQLLGSLGDLNLNL